ncbi:MAG TPA: hypothetical protein VFD21_02190 [Vicinamibacterales bacterium]|jgi:hypothetical protein|nr:hypothetical protein [Vicinamibacterales bacterium]
MTFIERIDALSSRFLSERSYDLIVGPAIADLQHDAGDGQSPRSMRGSFPVLVAFAGAAYDEITADSGLWRIGALALIPAMYYAFLIVLILPEAGAFVTARSGLLALAIAIAAMSFAPVLVCCWPERRPRRPDTADA